MWRKKREFCQPTHESTHARAKEKDYGVEREGRMEKRKIEGMNEEKQSFCLHTHALACT